MMAKRNQLAKGEKSERSKKANKLYKEAITLASGIKGSIAELGKIAAQLRTDSLWKDITDAKGRPRFTHWTQVGSAVLGGAGKSKLYALIDCYELTLGPNPIPAKTVKRMGVKRAEEVAKLEPEDRTAEIIEAATTKPVMAVRNQVRAKMNENLPQQEQKPMLQLFAINLPTETAERLEALLEVMIYMDGIRDGDNTLSMRQKAITEMIRATDEYFAQEIGEAIKLKAAAEGVSASPAAAAAGPEYPDEEEEDEDFVPDAVTEAHIQALSLQTGR